MYTSKNVIKLKTNIFRLNSVPYSKPKSNSLLITCDIYYKNMYCSLKLLQIFVQNTYGNLNFSYL